MRQDMDERIERHLTREERELFLPDVGPERPPVALRSHVDSCDRCRGEVEDLRALHAALASLPRMDPRPGFAEAVMARVRLPVPWHARAWNAVRGRWLPVVLAAALVAVTVGAGAWWLASQPELTLGGLVTFTFHRLTALFWTAVVAGGRLAWESGVPGFLRTTAGRIGVTGALAGMAALVVASLLTTVAMAKMVAPDWSLARTRRS